MLRFFRSSCGNVYADKVSLLARLVSFEVTKTSRKCGLVTTKLSASPTQYNSEQPEAKS